MRPKPWFESAMRPARTFRPRARPALAVLLLVLVALGCGKSQKGKAGRGEPGVMAEVAVPGDKPIKLVLAKGGSKRVLVYLPPKCADPLLSFAPWAEALSDLGTVVELLGDRPCGGTPHFELGDVASVQRRVDAALVVVKERVPEIEPEMVLVGYSQGAARAEELAERDAARFPRVLLIGAPTAPSATRLKHQKAVATMAGDKDRRDLMMTGTAQIEHAGVPSKFFLLPGAVHGEMGTDGPRVMREALGWLLAR